KAPIFGLPGVAPPVFRAPALVKWEAQGLFQQSRMTFGHLATWCGRNVSPCHAAGRQTHRGGSLGHWIACPAAKRAARRQCVAKSAGGTNARPAAVLYL